MRIGTLRRRLVLEREDLAPDGAGGVTRTVVVDGGAFGSVEPVRRGEAVERERNAGVVTHRVTLRFRDDVGRGVRFFDGAVRLRVLATEADAARRWLTCLCEEVQT